MKTLDRSLGLSAVISVSLGSMLGSGIFVLPGLAFSQTGGSVWLAYLVAAICVMPAAFSKSELATAMPTSGGSYVYIERTFGPLMGTISGLGLFLSLLLKSAFALVGISAYLGVMTSASLIPTSLSLLLFIVLLNILGVGKVSKAIILVVCVSILSLLLLVGYGAAEYDPELLQPFFKAGAGGFLVAAAMVVVSYSGVIKVAAIAEEVKSPEANLPKGMLYSLLIVTALYCLVTFVLGANIPQIVLSGDLKPIHTLAELLGGHSLGIAISTIAIVTMASMANAGILAASRFPFAMSRDHLLPGFLGQLSRRFMTPFWSIILSGVIVAGVILVLDVQKIAKLASSFMILMFIMVNLAVVVLRETRVQWYKPEYKSPFYPWVQLFGIVSLLVLLVAMKSIVLTGVLSISIPGLLIYIFYSRKRTERMGVIGLRGIRKDLTEESGADFSFGSRRLEQLRFPGHAKVVVPLFGKEKSPEVLIEMGAALADGELMEVTHLTEVPEQAALSDIYDDSAQIRSLRRRINALSAKQNTPVAFDPVVSHDIIKSVHDISQRLHCQWLVAEWGGKTRGAFTLHNPMGWLKNHLSCHLAVFRDTGVRYVRKVLVVIKSDEHDRLLISTADHLARVNEASLTIVKVTNENIDHEEEEALLMVLRALGKSYCFSPVTVELLKGDDPVQTVISTSVEYDLVVLGDTEKTDMKGRFFGTDTDKTIQGVTCSVVSVRPCPKP